MAQRSIARYTAPDRHGCWVNRADRAGLSLSGCESGTQTTNPLEQEDAVLVRDTVRNQVTVYREIDPVNGEKTRLYCHSTLIEKKA